MNKQQEALRLALEALEYISSHYMSLPKIGCMALAAIEEALAEQETVLPGGGHVPAVPVAVYGYCPECGGAGVMRERRPNGDDKCTNGHKYPSSKALAEQPAQPYPDNFIHALMYDVAKRDSEAQQAYEDAFVNGTGVMLGDKRIDPASIYKQPEQDNTYNYAKNLAEAIFKQHFAGDEHYASGRIVWGVNDTVIGILTQIDNMVADMVRRPAQQHIEHCLWARNGHTPCPHVQPAQQQEPVAWATRMGEYAHIHWGAKRPEYPMVYEVPLYTSPPASKPEEK